MECSCYDTYVDCHGNLITICNGTRERDICDCCGDTKNCTYYPKNRNNPLAFDFSSEKLNKLKLKFMNNWDHYINIIDHPHMIFDYDAAEDIYFNKYLEDLGFIIDAEENQICWGGK